MKIEKFVIPIYEYKVIYIQVERDSDAVEIEKILRTVSENEPAIKNTISSVKTMLNGGECYYNFDKITSVIVITRCTSELDKCKVIAHEKRHLEDDVLRWAQINDKESAALLAGYLHTKLFK